MAMTNATPYNAPTYFAASYFASGAAIPAPVAGPTPYNAPTYFAASYFYGSPRAATIPTTGRTRYNPPTYFAATYFYGNSAADSPPIPLVVQPTAGRDGGAYAALVAALGAVDDFESVRFGDPSRRDSAGADSYPAAVIVPKGWEETDDADPTLLVRRVSFTVRLVIRVEEDADPFDELDRLTRAVQAAVDRSDLDGSVLPALTKIRAGRYQASSRYPEWSVDLDGEFTTLVDPAPG